jgi:hypothetical protein
MDIRAREDELFTKWKGKYDSFVIDGAPNPAAFLASPMKTAIVLKDVNAPEKHVEPFDLRKQLETVPNKWWRTVANWCAGISRLSERVSWDELKKAPVKESLAPFAFIQLKKTPGGGAVTNKTLKDCARRDSEEIRTQLCIYQPDVIIGCGATVGDNLAYVVGGGGPWGQRKNVNYMELTLYGKKKTYLIDYRHPSVRGMTRESVCYGLLDACREIVHLRTAAVE